MTEIVTNGTETRIIQFTVVPGVQSGYQLLMKPVVFTTMKEAETVNPGETGATEESSLETKPASGVSNAPILNHWN